MENNPLQPVFNVIQGRQPTPLEQLASLRETQQQLGLQGLEQQRQGIEETRAQLEQLQANAPDQKKQAITRALLAAGDLLGGTGGKASQLYQMFQPPDTTQQQTALQKLLASQRAGLSKAELGLLDQQLTSQMREQELALLGQRVAGANQPKPLHPLDAALKQATLQEKEGKIAKQKAAEAQGKETVKNIGQLLVRDTSRAMDIIDKHGSAATGAVGAISSVIPGTPAHDLSNLIDSIEGNVAIDQLIQLKKNNVGLGQVPQSQLTLLSKLMGSLRQTQDPETLKTNIQQIENLYSDIVKKSGGDPKKLYNQAVQGGKITEGGTGTPMTPAPVYQSPTANKLKEEWGL